MLWLSRWCRRLSVSESKARSSGVVDVKTADGASGAVPHEGDTEGEVMDSAHPEVRPRL